jgi:hypothetical protein
MQSRYTFIYDHLGFTIFELLEVSPLFAIRMSYVNYFQVHLSMGIIFE